jgi:hypothetical protein
MVTSNPVQHAQHAFESLTFPTRVSRKVMDPSASYAWQHRNALQLQDFVSEVFR